MKTWKKIIGATALTGVALGALAYFAKKKSLEDSFSDEFDDTFEDFDEELTEKESDKKADSKETNRDYVPINLDNEPEQTEEAKETTDNSKVSDNKPEDKKNEE